jgi:DNA-binding MarR family transcriptional regulator
MKYKEEFWAIPKSIFAITGLSLKARCTYAILWTRMNGENVAWPGQASLAETLGVGRRSVQRYLDELRDKGLIEVERRGQNRTNRYILSGQIGASGCATALSHPDATVLAHPSIEKNSSKRTAIAADAAGAPWTDKDLGSYLQEMVESPNRGVRIVAMFLGHKSVGVRAGTIRLATKAQAQAEIRRHIRAASTLKSHSDEQIEEVMGILSEYAKFDWKLETVGKYINYDRSKLVELLRKMR